MRLRAAVASDRGLIRPSNEDSFFLRRGLYAVCDGMGGARAGEVASQMACLGLLALDPVSACPEELRTAVVITNKAIFSRSFAEEHLLGMGTTLTAVHVREGSQILAHVGDSRAYLFHDGSLIQLSDDHSWVGEMVRRGELTPAQAAVHPHRSVITRALGTDGGLEPDLNELDIGEGDRILICSDGLSGFVSDVEIAELLARDEAPSAVVESLVRAALAGGGVRSRRRGSNRGGSRDRTGRGVDAGRAEEPLCLGGYGVPLPGRYAGPGRSLFRRGYPVGRYVRVGKARALRGHGRRRPGRGSSRHQRHSGERP